MVEVMTFMVAFMFLLILILVVLIIVWAFKAPSQSEKSRKVKGDLSKIKRQIDDEEE